MRVLGPGVLDASALRLFELAFFLTVRGLATPRRLIGFTCCPGVIDAPTLDAATLPTWVVAVGCV